MRREMLFALSATVFIAALMTVSDTAEVSSSEAVSALRSTQNAAEEYGTFIWGEDNWQFRNTSSVFGKTYLLTEDDRSELEENFSNIEMHMASELLDGEFLGSCYGMAALSVMACYDLIDYASYRVYEQNRAATSLYDMTTAEYPPTAEMLSLCNYYTALQFTEEIRQYTAWSMCNMTDAQRLQQLIDNAESGIPTLVSYFGSFDSEGNRNGHAVVGCGVEYGSFEVDVPYTMAGTDLTYFQTRTYNGRIRLYDNQSYEDSEDYLYFSTDGMSWYCNGSDSENGGTICMTISDVNLLNAGGLLEGTEEYVNENEFIALLNSGAIHSENHLQKINFENDSWTAIDDTASEINGFPVFLGDTVEAVSKIYKLPCAESGYVMSVKEAESLELEMNYQDSLLHADVSQGTQAVFHPSGYIEMSGTDADYTFEMVFNDGNYQGSWYDFTVSGNADTASLQKTEGGYILKSDNLQDITVTANNDTTKATAAFSIDNADSVLLYEIDENTIGVDVILAGDCNLDGVFNADDIVMLQKWLLGVGNLACWKNADFNQDDTINGIDLRLMRSAYME